MEDTSGDHQDVSGDGRTGWFEDNLQICGFESELRNHPIQPHTSAGRIPSDLGYRLYVNHLMEEKEQQVTEMKELMIEKQDKMEMVLKRVAQFLAANTNYASMITGPQYHRTKLKFIQLSIVSEDQLLAVVVTEGNVVKNKMISLHHGLDQETVLKLNILLNTSLNGLTMDQINLTTIAKIKEEAGIHSEVVNSVLDAVAEAIQMDEEEMEIYTSGATNIFKYPELSDSEKASSLIGTFEEKKQLADLVADTMADDKNTGIQVNWMIYLVRKKKTTREVIVWQRKQKTQSLLMKK